MSDIKDLLKLIEKNDPVKILSLDNIVERLNILFKYELILFTEGQISLSAKGREFRENIEDFSSPPTTYPELAYMDEH